VARGSPSNRSIDSRAAATLHLDQYGSKTYSRGPQTSDLVSSGSATRRDLLIKEKVPRSVDGYVSDEHVLLVARAGQMLPHDVRLGVSGWVRTNLVLTNVDGMEQIVNIDGCVSVALGTTTPTYNSTGLIDVIPGATAQCPPPPPGGAVN